MRKRMTRALLIGALSLVPAVSAAQSAAESAARRVLLDQAATARAGGDHARALELAERAGRLSMSPSLRMFIAEEQLAIGRFAPALGTADQCVRETERDVGANNREAILARCRALLTELRPHVGYVTVRVADSRPADLRITVSGDVISDALYGVPYVVTPGDVVIDAVGTGIQPYHQTVTIAAGASIDVPMTFAAALVTNDVTSSSSPEPTSSGPPEVVVSDTTPGHAPVRVVPPSPINTYGPIVLGGVGLVGVFTSIGFFVARNAAVSGCMVQSAQILCPDAPTYTRAQPAPTFNALADITLGVGIVAIAGAAAWFVANRLTGHAPSDSRRASMIFAAPSADGFVVSFQRGF